MLFAIVELSDINIQLAPVSLSSPAYRSIPILIAALV
jgi:hypothetical protein